MKVNKITITETEQDIAIAGITLLTKKEAEALPKKQRAIGEFWWLRSPSSIQSYAADVYGNGALYSGHYVSNYEYGVRPALKISNLESTNLTVGDKFEMAGQDWTIISEDTALCNGIVGKTYFRKDWKAVDANNYDASDVKEWLAKWAAEKGIEIDHEKAIGKPDRLS